MTKSRITATITGIFLSTSVAAADTFKDVTDEFKDMAINLENAVFCSPNAEREHAAHWTKSQKLIEDSALMIGCLLFKDDINSDMSDNINLAVRKLQENLAAFAEAYDIDLKDKPKENGDFDGILGPATTKDFITITKELGVYSIFRPDIYAELSLEGIYLQRLKKELKEHQPVAVEQAEKWAKEEPFAMGDSIAKSMKNLLDDLLGPPQLPNLFNKLHEIPGFKKLPLCENVYGSYLNEISCAEKANFSQHGKTNHIPRKDI